MVSELVLLDMKLIYFDKQFLIREYCDVFSEILK